MSIEQQKNQEAKETGKNPERTPESKRELLGRFVAAGSELYDRTRNMIVRLNEKIRYYYEESGVEYEVDVFRGELEGLVIVDVEFDSLEKQKTFTAPSWCLAEVTQEKLFAGGMLAGKKYSDIEDCLQKFGYKKLHAD